MKTIESFLRVSVDEGAFPGAVWIVGRKDSILEQGAAGSLGIGLGKTKVDTIYDIASLTKIIVTLAIMRQAEQGALRLMDSIDHFLPAYKNHPKGRITLFELLTHTSVIPGKLQLYHYARNKEDLLEAIRWCGERADSPGKVDYTSKGYIILGEAAAAIDGEGLDEVVRKRVLEPLLMTETCYNPPPSIIDRIAPTEDCPWRGRIVRGQVHDENAVVMGGVAGHAGLFSTSGDLAKLCAAMLELSGSFLNPATIKMMTQDHTAGKGEHRGLGFVLRGPANEMTGGDPSSVEPAGGDLMSANSFGHTGFTGTSIWIDPEKDLYAVLLSNRIHPRRDNDGIFRVRHIFHNLAVIHYGGKKE